MHHQRHLSCLLWKSAVLEDVQLHIWREYYNRWRKGSWHGSLSRAVGLDLTGRLPKSSSCPIYDHCTSDTQIRDLSFSMGDNTEASCWHAGDLFMLVARLCLVIWMFFRKPYDKRTVSRRDAVQTQIVKRVPYTYLACVNRRTQPKHRKAHTVEQSMRGP